MFLVEVFGDDTSWLEMEDKVRDYHGFGVDMVWIADPQTRTVKQFPLNSNPVILYEKDTVQGGAILPGMSIPIAQFFVMPPGA